MVRFTKVRSHIRKTKKGVTVVKRHKRKTKGLVTVNKHIRTLRGKYGVKTPIEVDLDHKAEQHDSLAHHELQVDTKGMKPSKHILRFDVNKIAEAGENLDDVIEHEFNHILDVELAKKNGSFKDPNDTFSKTEQGKNMLKKFRKGANMRRSNKELFADVNNL